MRRCLDEGNAPALHHAVSLCVSVSIGFDLLTVAARLPFPGHGVEISGVLDLYEGSGSDNVKVRGVGFLDMMASPS